MAIYWPSATSSCRVDILTATITQIETSLRCQGASYGEARSEAPGYFETFLTIRTAYGALTGSQTAIAALQSKAIAEVGAAARASVAQANAAALDQSERASGALIDQLNRAKQAELSLIDQATRAVTGAIGSAQSFIGGAVGSAADAIGGVIGNASSAVGGLIDAAAGTVGSVIGEASSTVGNLVSAATAGIGGALSEAGSFLGTLVGNVSDTLGSVLAGAGDALGGVVSFVRSKLADLVTGLGSAVGALIDGIEGLPAVLGGVVDTIVSAAGAGIGPILDTIGGFLTDPVGGIIGSFFEAEEGPLTDHMRASIDRALRSEDMPETARPLLNMLREPKQPIVGIGAVLVLPLIVGPIIQAILQPSIDRMTQEEQKAVRSQLLGFSDLIEWAYRHPDDTGYVYDRASRLGVVDDDVRRAIELHRPQPNAGDLLDWYYRKVIDLPTLQRKLGNLGYSDEDIARIVAASPIQAPLSDLVRFVVRESLPGQSAYSGAAGASVPGSFTESAAKLGLPAETARSYWAAHWELPSVSQVFEMYHRGIVTEAQLDAYLVQADVMPEWRDRLKAIGFDPLTRVDVRRMYDLGILDLAGVERAYRDIGYSSENAHRLALFTAKLAAADQAASPDPERDLTRADLVGSYADGILTRAETDAHLRKLGYSADETGLILDREDIRAARAERKAARDGIVEQATARVITFEVAGDKLRAAGFTTDETDAALREIRRKLDAAAARPTKADLDRFRKAKLITAEEYHSELVALGYSERWATLYGALLSKGGPTNA